MSDKNESGSALSTGAVQVLLMLVVLAVIIWTNLDMRAQLGGFRSDLRDARERMDRIETAFERAHAAHGEEGEDPVAEALERIEAKLTALEAAAGRAHGASAPEADTDS